METGKAKFSDPSNRSGFYQAILYEFIGSALVTWAYNLGRKNYMIRAAAYLAGYLFAAGVSGAHFNPATSIAVYLAEKKKQANNTYLATVIVMQVLGAFLGVLVGFCAVKDYFVGIVGNYTDYGADSFSLYPVPP